MPAAHEFKYGFIHVCWCTSVFLCNLIWRVLNARLLINIPIIPITLLGQIVRGVSLICHSRSKCHFIVMDTKERGRTRCLSKIQSCFDQKTVHVYTLTAVDSSTDKAITFIHCKLLWQRQSSFYRVTKNVLQGSRVSSQYISHLFKSSAVFFFFCGSLFWAEIEKRLTRLQRTEKMCCAVEGEVQTSG